MICVRLMSTLTCFVYCRDLWAIARLGTKIRRNCKYTNENLKELSKMRWVYVRICVRLMSTLTCSVFIEICGRLHVSEPKLEGTVPIQMEIRTDCQKWDGYMLGFAWDSCPHWPASFFVKICERLHVSEPKLEGTAKIRVEIGRDRQKRDGYMLGFVWDSCRHWPASIISEVFYLVWFLSPR